MALGEDKRPEANRHFDFRPSALQHHTQCEFEDEVSLPTLAEYRLVANEISDAMSNSRVKGKVINSEEPLILYCDKHLYD